MSLLSLEDLAIINTTLAQHADLYRNYYIVCIDNKIYQFPYDDEPVLNDLLLAISKSIKELTIYERPSDSSVIRHLFDSPENLQSVIIFDHIAPPDQRLIRRRAPNNAEVIFCIPHLAAFLKSSTYQELVFDKIPFSSFLLPFKDLGSFQSIKHLSIHHGSFENDNFFDPEDIQTFVKLINSFPNLETIEVYFKLKTKYCASRRPLYDDSYDGYEFYHTMKKMKASLYQGLSEKVHGTIHFGARINSFPNMWGSKKDALNQSSKSIKPPIKYNEAVIARKFRPHPGLQIEFSITPASD